MRLRHLCLLAAAGLAAFVVVPLVAAAPARAALLIEIDKAAQKMTVSVDGEPLHEWPVSTGQSGYDTPAGEYKPFRMERDHFSREWDDAPMPFSIFFTQEGHAIHGTFDAKNLGKPASHGCVRLSRTNAATLWGLVRQQKMANTKVVLTGEIPAGSAPAVARRPQPRQDSDYDRRYSSDMDDDDYTPPPPTRRQREVRGWREYNDGPRYYYRERPFVERRIYRSAPFPFPFGW
jgi:hypothetical protein